MGSQYAGANWVKKQTDEEMSDLGVRVADLLGMVFLGIYHISHQTARVDWTNKDFIEINIDRSMASFDDDLLTRLVLLSHDLMIRVDIGPCNFRYIKLLFHARLARDGDIYQRMPTLEDHVAFLRKHYAEMKERER